MTATLAAWLHTLDPVIVWLTGSLAVRWYGVAYLLGFVIAYTIFVKLAKRGFTPIPPHRVADAMMWLVGGVLIGGRLGYAIVYQPSLLWTFHPGFPWWDLLAINKGGMASHGGILGVIIAAYRISRGWKTPDGRVEGRCDGPHVMDLTAALCPIGLGLGRLANFINGELLGKIVTPPGVEGPAWAVQFPQELLDPKLAPKLTPEQADQLDALVAQAARPGDSYVQALERLVDRAGEFAAQLKPLLSSRHPSQLYQMLAEGVIVGAVVWLIWAKPRKPGVVGSWFLISYGVLRIATEFWRLPDTKYAVGRPYGLSRGQWLSALMATIGVIALMWSIRRGTQKMGGWLRRSDGAARAT